MLLTLVITLLLIWAAVVGAIYSNFLTFYWNFSETENYNKAYYASIAALERAELVVKQREPWYQWTWWRISKFNWWNLVREGTWSDWPLTWFSYLSSWSSKWTDVLWDIKSRTTRIPEISWWNVDWMLSSWDSLNYNIMDYENAEITLLYYDDLSGNPYKKTSCLKWDCIKSELTQITWEIRLPEKLKDNDYFWNLDTNSALIWNIKDDWIVDWQFRWNYRTGSFTIYSTQDISNRKPTSSDTVIRESDINSGVRLRFADKASPIIWRWNNTKLTIISSSPLDVNVSKFKDIFDGSSFSQLQLRLALLNLLRPKDWAIYPYLEYYLDFWDKEVSDKYYTIDAEWKYWDFQVDLIVQKPTAKESILWSFTTVLQ